MNTAELETLKSHEAALRTVIWNNPPWARAVSAEMNQAVLFECCPEKPLDLHTDTEISQWTGSRARRFVDVAVALFLLLLLVPVFCVLYAVVRAGSRGPVIFRQKRVGQSGSLFTMYKFRTMLHAPGGATQLRSGQRDNRLTAQGFVLRNYKLDELPQLVNVLRGEMSLVGPRPLLPEHSAGRLPCRPGLTGQASLAFASEALLVKDVPEHLLEEFHRKFITPLKLRLDGDYMKTASFAGDLRILWRTLRRRGCYRDVAALNVYTETEIL